MIQIHEIEKSKPLSIIKIPIEENVEIAEHFLTSIYVDLEGVLTIKGYVNENHNTVYDILVKHEENGSEKLFDFWKNVVYSINSTQSSGISIGG